MIPFFYLSPPSVSKWEFHSSSAFDLPLLSLIPDIFKMHTKSLHLVSTSTAAVLVHTFHCSLVGSSLTSLLLSSHLPLKGRVLFLWFLLPLPLYSQAPATLASLMLLSYPQCVSAFCLEVSSPRHPYSSLITLSGL